MDRYFAEVAQPFDWSPRGKDRGPAGGGTSWDSTATIYHPTRKPYWQRIKCISEMTFAQKDAILKRCLARWQHE